METKQVIKRQAKTHYLTELINIFKPIRRGAREKAKEIHYQYGNGSKITVWLFKELDIADQDLFLTIISLIAEYNHGEKGTVNSENEYTKNLREKLELTDLLFELPILRMKTTLYRLLDTMGKKITKQNYKWCIESLTRLSRCGITYHTDKYVGSTNLLSFSVDPKTNEIHIAINPVSASVFLSNDKYVIHNLTERFSLKMEATKALQSYLNKQLTLGQTKTLTMNTIIKGVYGNLDDIRYRRRTIKKAIEELTQHKEYKYTTGLNNSYSFTRHSNLLKI